MTAPATTPAAIPTVTGSPAVSACSAAGLRVTLVTTAAGVAAGSSLVPLQFANTSGHLCKLAGYPEVSFQAGSAGQTIGRAAAPDRSVLADSVLLAPGGIAHAWLQVLDTANIPASQCHPVTADGLRVGLPGAAGAAYVAHTFAACAASVSGMQILTIQPVRVGPAQRGGAQ